MSAVASGRGPSHDARPLVGGRASANSAPKRAFHLDDGSIVVPRTRIRGQALTGGLAWGLIGLGWSPTQACADVQYVAHVNTAPRYPHLPPEHLRARRRYAPSAESSRRHDGSRCPSRHNQRHASDAINTPAGAPAAVRTPAKLVEGSRSESEAFFTWFQQGLLPRPVIDTYCWEDLPNDYFTGNTGGAHNHL